jgi:hypothetical protein
VRNLALEQENAGRLVFVWKVLLLPWVIAAPWLAFAYDAPETTTLVAVWMVWSYPVSVCIAWALWKKHPLFALFPCMNLLVFAAILEWQAR